MPLKNSAPEQTTLNPLLIPQEGGQRAVYECPFPYIFVSGTRGSGKSLAVIQRFYKHIALNEQAGTPMNRVRGVIIRKTYKELAHLIDLANEAFVGYSFHDKSKNILRFKNGARLEFSYLENEKDLGAYQGHEFSFICVDEVQLYATPKLIPPLIATMRNPGVVNKTLIMTANPGGAGHQWCRDRYVKRAPPCTPFAEEGQKEMTVHIPTTFKENKALLATEPDYEARLIQATIGDEYLRAAWLDNDWDAVIGGAFSGVWDKRVHILPRFVEAEWRVPQDWVLTRSYDWGWNKPFSIGWYFRTNGEGCLIRNQPRYFPANTLIRVAEFYGCKQNQPNTGLRWTEDKIVDGILEREAELFPTLRYRISSGVADTNIFNTESHGQAPVTAHQRRNVHWRKANKKSGTRVAGWNMLRSRLAAARSGRNEEPAFYVTENCWNAINQIPVWVLDQTKPEDLDTTQEDHLADEIRYMCLDSNVMGGTTEFRFV